LGRAEEAVTALGEVRNAEAAIDAGKAAQWAALRTLHEKYAALPEGHVALLRAADPESFGVGSDALAFAFFNSPLRAGRSSPRPTTATRAATGSTTRGSHPRRSTSPIPAASIISSPR
jgi:hypothetical protein